MADNEAYDEASDEASDENGDEDSDEASDADEASGASEHGIEALNLDPTRPRLDFFIQHFQVKVCGPRKSPKVYAVIGIDHAHRKKKPTISLALTRTPKRGGETYLTYKGPIVPQGDIDLSASAFYASRDMKTQLDWKAWTAKGQLAKAKQWWDDLTPSPSAIYLAASRVPRGMSVRDAERRLQAEWAALTAKPVVTCTRNSAVAVIRVLINEPCQMLCCTSTVFRKRRYIRCASARRTRD